MAAAPIVLAAGPLITVSIGRNLIESALARVPSPFTTKIGQSSPSDSLADSTAVMRRLIRPTSRAFKMAVNARRVASSAPVSWLDSVTGNPVR